MKGDFMQFRLNANSPIPSATKKLMKEGVKHNLVPLANRKGPDLKLSPETKITINDYNSLIRKCLREIDNLEFEKYQIGLSPKEILRIDSAIEKHLACIANTRQAIYDIKKEAYKTQLLNEKI